MLGARPRARARSSVLLLVLVLVLVLVLGACARARCAPKNACPSMTPFQSQAGGALDHVHDDREMVRHSVLLQGLQEGNTADGIEHLTERHELGLFSKGEMMQGFRGAGLKVEYSDEGPSGKGPYVGTRGQLKCKSPPQKAPPPGPPPPGSSSTLRRHPVP